ncbi:MAG: hypothetical protein A2W93_05690 [Bacteroidetes bacterium GWF2_43_63]|nr:MAG: hypothetical protein A2W94_07375 [Bacteroidetes bacterium GWE2_42_42]OFY55508.1 MAG: hypothetical protein A2W93_05690 [Bacteroidetes bacterium GWF2_43_63]HBG69986.1 hypothetical protein [Bacteroidales bacterium]HCB62589.1 hypothetical protein [Bacteroidales bacterium]HCY23709.1 hypothetical protein [Bacteroidales bacterium]
MLYGYAHESVEKLNAAITRTELTGWQQLLFVPSFRNIETCFDNLLQFIFDNPVNATLNHFYAIDLLFFINQKPNK